MSRTRDELRELPAPLRHAVVVGSVFAVLGALVGLVLGVRTHVPTAWAAVLEVGVPAALLGAVLGLASGSIAWSWHRTRHR